MEKLFDTAQVLIVFGVDYLMLTVRTNSAIDKMNKSGEEIFKMMKCFLLFN